MRWLIILIILLAVVAAVWLWRSSQKASLDIDSQIRNQQASTDAQRRLDAHRNPRDGSGGSGAGGVGGVF